MEAHVEPGTMVTQKHYNSKLLNHLGLIAGMYDELGIGEVIDQILPQNEEKRVVSVGQAVKAMVLNGLGFAHRALYLTPLFFQDKPVGRLIGKGLEAQHLNDDVLGRALDAIYAYGPDRLYPQLAAPAVKHLGLLCRFGHLDATSFHTDGRYNSAREEPEEGVIHITKGYSRDHRPDLNQVALQLICERQAGIPLLMEVLSGNNSDKKSFRSMINAHVAQMRGDFKIEYIVADSALYVAETIKNMNDFLWISRVPETLTLACDMIHAIAPDLMINLEQGACRNIGTVYGDVRQRWMVVYSPEARQRTLKTVDKHCLQQSTSEFKDFEKLCKQDFACEADARKALTLLEKKLNLTFVSDVRVTAQAHYKEKGRPAHDRAPDFYIYRVEGSMASNLQERTRRLERKSCFIIATNQLDCQSLSDEELIGAYKDQQKVERGFRFLKDPMFMASTLFLKSPQRIMALMMVMTLCLLVYAALEHRIREVLKEHNETFPDQKGMPITNPTARWVFQFFGGIHVLVIEQLHVLVLNLNDHHATLLRLLGKRYEALYSGNG
jgi:transposase